MARRFVYFQKAIVPPSYPLKLLLEGPSGYYVGGWDVTPVLVAPFSNASYQDIYLQGITAIGPGPSDWLVGGWARNYSSVPRLVFYGFEGFIGEYVPSLAGGAGFISTGRFGTVWSITDNRRWWATATSAGTTSVPPASDDFGYVLPSVFSGSRIDTFGDGFSPLREAIVPNPDLTYAVFRGDYATPTTNPWLATAGGSFTNLTTNLNAAIPKCDLIGLMLYERAVDFIGTAPWTEGNNTLSITPHTLTVSGGVTTGTPFEIAYIAPNPEQYFSWDASLWVAPSTTP